MKNNLQQKFEQIDELLGKAKRILIAAHENPDPDAVASILVLHYFFKKRDLESFPYLPNKPPKYLSFLPGFFEIKTASHLSKNDGGFQPDLLFGLDYGDFKRLRIPEEILQKDSLDIVTIDHHLESDQRGQVKILEPEISSTAEIIYYLLKHWGVEVNQDIATCLLAGIFSDSGGFRHVSTSAETFRVVSELLLKGVSLDKIVRCTLAFQKPINLSRAWGQILARTKLEKETGLAYSWITLEDFKRFGINMGDFDGITNLISAGSPRNLGLFLVEHQPGRVKGSLRSEPAGGIDVVKIARPLGGGGHPYAAGFQQEGTIKEVLKKVINLIE
jgi:phosphoesterase RecJ-like protein